MRDTPMKTRALSSDDKSVKRMVIINAARQLFQQDDRQLPVVANIAKQAGLAKGTVYLYFRTKEEIFLALLAEEFSGLLSSIQQCLPNSGQSLKNDEKAEVVDNLIGAITGYVHSHAEFLRLDAMAYSVLEQNLSDDILYSFKFDLTRALVSTGNKLDAALMLAAGRGVSLLLRTYALMRGLWQTLDYPKHLQKLLADPMFAPIRPEFQHELSTSLREYWLGALNHDV